MTYDRSASALFTEILRNDRIDLAARLPEAIDFHFTQDQLARCFDASRILWQTSLERNALVQMARTLIKTGEITPGDQLRFKLTLVNAKRRTMKMRGEAFVDGQLVAEADLLATSVDTRP